MGGEFIKRKQPIHEEEYIMKNNEIRVMVSIDGSGPKELKRALRKQKRDTKVFLKATGKSLKKMSKSLNKIFK